MPGLLNENPYVARMLKAGCNIYQAGGYYNRYDYLRCMSEDYDIPLSDVKELADRLGEQEDFAGLPKQLDELKNRSIANAG